jgi:anti-sigma B factor antagonist
MDIRIENSPVCDIVRLSGDFDLYGSPRIKLRITDMIAEQGMRNLVIDLAEVKYIDSSGVGALLYFFSMAQKERCGFFVSSLTPPVHHVLQLTQLVKFLPIAKTAADAVSSFCGIPVREGRTG